MEQDAYIYISTKTCADPVKTIFLCAPDFAESGIELPMALFSGDQDNKVPWDKSDEVAHWCRFNHLDAVHSVELNSADEYNASAGYISGDRFHTIGYRQESGRMLLTMTVMRVLLHHRSPHGPCR